MNRYRLIFIPLILHILLGFSKFDMVDYYKIYKEDSIRGYLYENFKETNIKSRTRLKEENNATLRINLVDKFGNPVADADVIIKNMENKKEKAMENRTDENGEVQFRGLAPEKYSIEVVFNKEKLSYDLEDIKLKNYVINTKTIFPKGDSESFQVAYLLVDQYDMPIRKAEIYLIGDDNKKYQARTDHYGYAYFKLDNPGKYRAYLKNFPDEIINEAEKNLLDFRIKEYSRSNTISYKSCEDVEYSDDYKSDLRLGIKFSKNYDDFSISLKDLNRSLIYSANPDKSAYVNFENLLPGNYDIRIRDKKNNSLLEINTYVGDSYTYIYDIVHSINDVSRPLILTNNLYVDQNYEKSKEAVSASLIFSSPDNLILTLAVFFTGYLVFKKEKNPLS